MEPVIFTREPVIETIITAKEGSKLVVRNSKGVGQEEYFVDAVEVISFGHAVFFRSLERPKCFVVPISDYEVLEVRETRIVLKKGVVEKGVKIGGWRESSADIRESSSDEESDEIEESQEEPAEERDEEGAVPAPKGGDRKRGRVRRRSRGRSRDGMEDEKDSSDSPKEEGSEETRSEESTQSAMQSTGQQSRGPIQQAPRESNSRASSFRTSDEEGSTSTVTGPLKAITVPPLVVNSMDFYADSKFDSARFSLAEDEGSKKEPIDLLLREASSEAPLEAEGGLLEKIPSSTSPEAV